MRANRRRDTAPEYRVRQRLHAAGLRFRVDMPVTVGPGRPPRPDVLFTKVRLAVFIDGCFWHGCPKHGRRQRIKNGRYWNAKLARNVERDYEQTRALRQAGWKVLRFWEHEDPTRVADKIRDVYLSLNAH